MKKRLLSALAAGALSGAALIGMTGAPAMAQEFGGNVGFSWSVSGAPSSGLTDLTFPTTFGPSTAHLAGTYVARQFTFMNQSNVGYIGLQPRPDENGTPRLHGTFSSFIAGTTSSDAAHCTNGADGGAGVSCAVEFDADYSHPFDVEVRQAGTDTWTGTVIDTVTGARTVIGTYKLPSGSGLMKSSQSGFIENYNHPGGCVDIQKIDVWVYAPRTSLGLPSTTSSPREYGDCLGKADYSAEQLSNGLHIQRGTFGSPEITQPDTPEQPEETTVPEAPAPIAPPTATDDCGAPWDARSIYFGGEIVSRDGRTFEAQWWTQSDPATASGPLYSGQPWLELGACDMSASTEPDAGIPDTAKPETGAPDTGIDTAPPVESGAPAWSPDTIYTAGDTVNYGGQTYRANWWIKGADPASHSGGSGSGQPWTLI